MKKITMKIGNTFAETFEDFILSRKAKGLSDKTLITYNQHFKAVRRHLDVDIPIDDLTKSDLECMVSSMRASELAPNTISSYVRTVKTFLSWCNDEEITSLKMHNYKCEETIKETYSDKELERLLKKPNTRKCAFSEYRTWVIINLLVNNGTRAATVRNIKNKDVDLENLVIYLRHTKSKKSQVIPLCTELCGILKEYMRIRGGSDDDFLFPTENGEQLKEHGLRSSIARYNNRRGIQRTSIHAFRHTFARKYLVDCGGNAFTLQRLLGHSTLDMTKHYCAIFDADIAKNYDKFSPLAQMKSNSTRIKIHK
ncbi:MAG: site-specific integrase [Ruminococcaceae bacterium]|nr:site-specific integrase [Oscillospiraceae bacterium]